MAFSLVQQAKATSSGGTTVAVTVTSSTAGSLLVALVGFNIGAVSVVSVTDNQSNTWVSSGAVASAANIGLEAWHCVSPTAGVTTVTVTVSVAAASQLTAHIEEWAKNGATAALDAVGVVNSGASTASPVGGAVTTTGAVGVAAGLLMLNNGVQTISGMTGGDDFTSGQIDNATPRAVGSAYLITSATGTYSPQWDLSAADTFAATTISFKDASATPPGGSFRPNKLRPRIFAPGLAR